VTKVPSSRRCSCSYVPTIHRPPWIVACVPRPVAIIAGVPVPIASVKAFAPESVVLTVAFVVASLLMLLGRRRSTPESSLGGPSS